MTRLGFIELTVGVDSLLTLSLQNSANKMLGLCWDVERHSTA